jgi:hypothetical protein
MDNLEKKSEFAKFLKRNWVKLLISVLFGLTIFLLIFFLNDRTLLSATNGAFYAFMSLFIVGVMSFVTNRGFFDIVGYNVLKLGHFFMPKRFEEVKNLNGTYDYTKMKEFKRKNDRFVCLIYLSISALFLVALITLYVILKVA